MSGTHSPSISRVVPPSSVPTPSEIAGYLDKFLVGQTVAKRVLASAVYAHYRLCEYADAGGTPVPARHRHVLLIGPTGVGKTEMIRRLTEFLGVPSVYMSATALTQSGYVGRKPTDMLRQLLEMTDGDVEAARRGLIFLDELDKRRRNRGAPGVDVAGAGAQMDLLPFLDGSVVSVQYRNREYQFDTNQLIVIAAGAFTEIGRRPLDPRISEVLREEVTAQDLIEYGLLDEFVGRFAQIVELVPLTIADFVRLIDTPHLLAAERRLIALHGAKLEITPRAKAMIAQVACEEENGARGLPRILKRLLRNVIFFLPKLSGEVIVIDCDAGRLVVGVARKR